MDFKALKSIFSGKDKKDGANRADGGRNKISGGRGAASGGRNAPTGGRNAPTGGREGKIAPVSPSRARLEKRANDDKIIKTIKIIFMTVVIVAIVGIVLSVFLYVYKPTVATVAGMGISQNDFVYQMKMMSGGSASYGSADTIAQQAINGAAETKILEKIARDRGITITQDDRDNFDYQMEYIDQLASYNAPGTSGDDYLRDNLGITKSQYKKIMESETYGRKLIDMEFEAIEIPVEDALAIYENDPGSYEEATVRHILFFYEGEHEDGTPREPEESELLALNTVARIEAGEDMAELVQELSEDGDLSNEGIYTFNRNEGFEQGFKDWTFDPDRYIGEVGICETAYGFHVMRLEDRHFITFEEAVDEITYNLKSDQVESIVNGWKNEPRFQLQINQSVYDTVVSQTLGY